MKLFLLICFSAALVIIAAVSVVGADRMPDWFLPAAVFGIPAFAIILVLALSASRRQKDQEARESKAILDTKGSPSEDG